MSSEHHENRRRKLAELQKNQRRDRVRLMSMAVLLVAAIAIFLQLGSCRFIFHSFFKDLFSCIFIFHSILSKFSVGISPITH